MSIHEHNVLEQKLQTKRRGGVSKLWQDWQRGEGGLGNCWQWLTKGGGGVGEMLAMATPSFLADIICEQPLNTYLLNVKKLSLRRQKKIPIYYPNSHQYTSVYPSFPKFALVDHQILIENNQILKKKKSEIMINSVCSEQCPCVRDKFYVWGANEVKSKNIISISHLCLLSFFLLNKAQLCR